MKTIMNFKLVLMAFALWIIISPAALATGITEAENKLNKAIENLDKAKKASESNPKAHGTDDPVGDAKKAVKDAADALDDARQADQVAEDKKVKDLEDKKVKKEKDIKKEKDAKKERDRNNPIREALKELAEKARAVAEAKASDYDKALEEYEDAKKKVGQAREEKEKKERIDKALEDISNAEEALKKAEEKYGKNPTKKNLEDKEDAEEALKKAREEAKKLEGNEQSALPERDNHRAVATISVGGTYTFDGPSPQFVTPETFYSALSSPETYADLYEALGGEFIIGELTSRGFTGVELTGRPRLMPGLGFGLNFPSGLELGFQLNRFHTDWSGSFPYTVIPFEGTSAQTYQGSVNRSISGMMTDVGARYFLTSGTIQPYLHAGVRGQWVVNDNTSVNMGNASFPLESSALDGNRFSLYSGAGARMNLGEDGFIQTGVSFAKTQNGYAPNVHVAIGWNIHGAEVSLSALNGQ